MWDQTLPQLFYRGGWVMYPLLASSIVGMAVALERICVFLWYRGNFPKFVTDLAPLVRARRFDDARTYLKGLRSPHARVAESYLAHLAATSELREQIVGREASEQIVHLERRMVWLGVIGQLAPMLGLLGTVTGLITAFHQIELQAGQVQPSDLAKGIWEALITTVFGLVVALPAMAIYNFLENRAGATALQLQWLVAYLDEWLGTPGRSNKGNATKREAATEPAEVPA